MKEIFLSRDISVHKPFIVTCGSGVTAAIIALAAYSISGMIPILYDGSWCEWVSRKDLPIEVG